MLDFGAIDAAGVETAGAVVAGVGGATLAGGAGLTTCGAEGFASSAGFRHTFEEKPKAGTAAGGEEARGA